MLSIIIAFMLQTGTYLCTILCYSAAHIPTQMRQTLNSCTASAKHRMSNLKLMVRHSAIYTHAVLTKIQGGRWWHLHEHTIFLCVCVLFFSTLNYWPTSSFIQAFQPYRIIQYESGKKALGSEAIITYCSALCHNFQIGTMHYIINSHVKICGIWMYVGFTH